MDNIRQKKVGCNERYKGMIVEINRIAALREAMNDELFLADLAETIEDFKYVDGEYKH